MPTRILIGSSVRQDPAVLSAHLQSLASLWVPEGIEVAYAFVDDNTDPASKTALAAFGGTILEAEPPNPEATYAVGASTHAWAIPTFARVGHAKQRLFNHAVASDYDAFFLVDSDLLLDPITLESLLSLRCDIASAVYWTRWQAHLDEPMPQVWLRNPYEFDGLGMAAHEFFQALVDRQAVRVIGGGACCLFRRPALERARFFPPPPTQPLDVGGMWPGEDRTLALTAQYARLTQWADAWPNIYHAYHPEQRTPEALATAQAWLTAPRQRFAGCGDLVAVALEALEDRGIQERSGPDIKCLRGRLGALPVLPELEAALFEMEVGEERLVELHFPYWHPDERYRSKSKIVAVKLLDVKPFSHPPVLADYMMGGVR